MALDLKQTVRLSQQLVMTPQLQQAIKLLQLSRLELINLVQQELQENPILEETLDEESTARPMPRGLPRARARPSQPRSRASPEPRRTRSTAPRRRPSR